MFHERVSFCKQQLGKYDFDLFRIVNMETDFLMLLAIIHMQNSRKPSLVPPALLLSNSLYPFGPTTNKQLGLRKIYDLFK